MSSKRAFYRRYQRDEIYNYYEVDGNSYTVVSFLHKPPIISCKNDSPGDGTNTKDIRENGEEITESEYRAAYNWALNDENVIIRGIDSKS